MSRRAQLSPDGSCRWALAGRASFDFLDGLVAWHVGILSSLVDGILCRLTIEPRSRRIAGGAGSRAIRTRASSVVTLWSRPKASPFYDNLVAMIEPQRSWSDQGTDALCRSSFRGFDLLDQGREIVRAWRLDTLNNGRTEVRTCTVPPNDFLARQTRAQPIAALAELIWNSLDSGASRVDIERDFVHHL